MKRCFPSYPIVLTQLSGVAVVVIGGGKVGERKVSGLIAGGARPLLISPTATEPLQAWALEGTIQWETRTYRRGDLSDKWMAIAATGQREVNAQIANEARELGILCDVVDAPEEGNFIVPALLRRENELVTVSTYGDNPKRAGYTRDRIAEWMEMEEKR